MEKVSVIITTYNRNDVVKRAIKSVEEQTYKNIELLVIDDHSTITYDSDIEIIKMPSHVGVSECRNYGYSIATGDYVCFLDDDDEWEKDKIEKQLKVINNKYDVVYTDVKELPYNRTKFSYGKDVVARYINDEVIIPSSIMVNKKNVRLRFKKEYEPIEDYECFLSLALNGIEFGYVNEKLTIKNNDTPKKHDENYINILELKLKIYRDLFEKTDRYRSILMEKILCVANRLYKIYKLQGNDDKLLKIIEIRHRYA